MGCHNLYINRQSWPGGRDCCSGTGCTSASGVVSNCIVHHFSFLSFISPFMFLFITIIITISIIKLLLSQPTRFTYFSCSFPCQVEGLGEEGVSSCVVLRLWLRFNHKKDKPNVFYFKHQLVSFINIKKCLPISRY